MNRQRCIAITISLLVILLTVFGIGDSASAMTTSAQGALLIEQSSGRVLFEYNSHKSMPMASTSKIFTALAVIRNCNLDDMVAVDRRAVGIEGSSIYLREGEHLTVRELLYGLMLQSGNDCATALAIHCSGSIEQFAKLVNNMCKEYGLIDTNIVTPHGLDHDNHYTSAYDLGRITCIALANKEFAKIVATKSIKISNEGYEYDRLIVNKNKLLTRYQYGDGVKTGYTKKAGRCFVGSATRNNMQLIAVVLNCGPMFEESESMIEYGFNNYTMTNIIPQNMPIKLSDCKNKSRMYYCKDSYGYPIKNGSDELERMRIEVHKSSSDPAIEVTLDKQLIFSQKLVTI